MRSVKSRSATCNSSIIPSAIGTVTLPEDTSMKLKQPAGMSEAFWKAVEETVSVVENYFAPSGGSSWPSVSDVILECFITADQVYGEDGANKFAENHIWT
jgi:hypothetical protein